MLQIVLTFALEAPNSAGGLARRGLGCPVRLVGRGTPDPRVSMVGPGPGHSVKGNGSVPFGKETLDLKDTANLWSI